MTSCLFPAHESSSEKFYTIREKFAPMGTKQNDRVVHPEGISIGLQVYAFL